MNRPDYSTLISRALSLKCPRCGNAPMFTGLFATAERCSSCHHKFDREPGYFLGSIYINYGITSIIITIAYIVLHFGYGLPNRPVLIGLVTFCVIFPTLFFRYARALWVAMDCYWDKSIFESPESDSRPTTP